MKLMEMPEAVINWSETPAIKIPGLTGYSKTRTQQAGDFRLRIVEYAPGYLADHWCSKGHVIHVVAGALVIEHQDERPACRLSAGMSWCVADEEHGAHRVRSESGASVFILD